MDISNLYMPKKSENTVTDEKQAKVIYGGPLFDGKGTVFENGCIYLSGSTILAVGREEDVFPLIPKNKSELELIDTQGKVIFPSLINTHHHFFSAYIRGLSPKGEVTSFEEKLDKLWWPLDKALDEESLQIAALISIMESIESGVTTIFDHHSSPSCIRKSLDIIAGAVTKSGINAVLCHEISDRNGKEKFTEALEENLSFIENYEGHKNLRGTLGLHANFTLSENSLKIIAKEHDPDHGVHIHAGENFSDFNFAKEIGYEGVIDRLNRFGLISPKAILAHGLYLSEIDLNLLEKHQSLLVHNPESNANNNLGPFDMENTKRLNVGLGTDGINSNMIQTMRSGFFIHRQKGMGENLLFEKLSEMLFRNNVACAQKFFERKLGVLEKGASADIVIFDYVPFTPFHENNIYRHLLFGMHDKKADTVISNGKIIFQGGVFISLDKELILEQATEISRKVWENYL
ncbi:MAG: putative aminohydrolase SsnA [Candidatus Marinimicrobia bacterium]|nr:putative aminohydrolase SsnA [Candidatus Neomarinimicrobiota bacterium]